MAAQRNVFAVGRGQYENIGDIILRRPLLDWSREGGRLHVYVGKSPEGYDRALGVGADDVVYRSLPKWYAALLKSALKGTASSVYKPGEIQLTLVGMKEHIVMLPAAALVRARGGSVSRVGVGARNLSPLPRAIMWPSNALSSYTRWRDERTAEYLGFGGVMPDLGYVEGLSDAQLSEAIDDTSRDVMVISLRDDVDVAPRPYPSEEWLAGVKAFADAEDLTIWVVTQVSVDNGRSRQLAKDLGARLLDWPDDVGYATQEERLRALYRRTRVAASDRLHVIIAAFTEGAAPVGLQLYGEDREKKVARHFGTIGIDDVAVETAGMPAAELAENLARITSRRAEMLRALLVARARLADVRREFVAVLADDPTAIPHRRSLLAEHRPRVYHVGRSGDIPGGMTQVVNAYLAWPFSRVDVEVIESRGDPGDHVAAARGFVRAIRKVRAISRSGQRAVIVVHLSERGSFVREGWVARYAASRGLPVIAHMHGSEFAAFERKNGALVGKVLAASSRVLSLSEETSEICARHVGADRVKLVPNAIPAGDATAKDKTVVFGGVVSHRKGIDVLQEAWRRAAPPEPWRLVIAGPIRDDHLVDPTLPQTEFAGSLGHDILMSLLDRASVAVLPSRDEAMPMFILEAMARRACVISTTVGGIPDVLSDGRGILVPPGSVEELTSALISATTDEPTRATIGDAGFDRFWKRFSADAVFPEVESVWLSALGVAADETEPAETGEENRMTPQPSSPNQKSSTT